MTRILNFLSKIKYYIIIGLVVLGAFWFWGNHNQSIGYKNCKSDVSQEIIDLRTENDKKINELYRKNLELNDKLKNNQQVTIYMEQKLPKEVTECINTNSCFSAH